MKRLIGFIVAGILIIALYLGYMEMTKEPLSRTSYALGTIITIDLFYEGDDALMNELVERVSEIEQLMSREIEDSEVSAISNGAGVEAVVVSDETYEVIKKALSYAELSQGSFDPTIEPIVGLWNIGTEEARVPSDAEIEEALQYVDYTKVILDDEAQSVYLAEKGMSLDLGGIAKGYVADELVVMLEEAGISQALINLGGNVYAHGKKDGSEPWNVGIHTPYDTRSTYFGYVGLTDKTVVTSGPYERYFEEDGQMYHHIFDARTGYPIEVDNVSVSIVAHSSMDADALSTLLFTMSAEEGLALIESLEDVECLYVDADYGLTISSGLEGLFTLTDETYYIK